MLPHKTTIFSGAVDEYTLRWCRPPRPPPRCCLGAALQKAQVSCLRWHVTFRKQFLVEYYWSICPVLQSLDIRTATELFPYNTDNQQLEDGARGGTRTPDLLGVNQYFIESEISYLQRLMGY